MTFWAGLLLGWIIGSIGTAIALLFFAAINGDERAFVLEEKLKGRRE